MKHDFDRLIDRRTTDCVKWDLLQEEFGRDDVLPMWVADMDFQAPPEVAAALSKRAAHDIYGYTIQPDSYHEAIRYWLHSRHGWAVEKEMLLSTPGIVPALAMAVLSFTEPGDKVILQPPVYHPFYSVIEGNKRQILANNMINVDGRYEMDLDDLAQKIDEKTKMIILCNPHNPVGRVWRKEKLERLGEICAKNNILVVCDEIHSDIIYKGNKHVPFASISEQFADMSITFMAPSKTFNIAGLATSFAVIPNETLRKRFNETQNALGLGMCNLFGIGALEAAYVNGEPWLEQLLEYLEGNMEYMVDFVNNSIDGITVRKPEGTYLGWLDCRGLALKGDKLKEFMIEKAKIGLSDGRIFGEPGEGFMRINVGCPRSLLVEGLDRIRKAVEGRNR